MANDRDTQATTRLKIRERYGTTRLGLWLAFLAFALWIIRDSVVKMHGDHPWLTMCLAIFGPTGLIVTIGKLYLHALDKKVKALNSSIDSASPPTDADNRLTESGKP